MKFRRYAITSAEVLLIFPAVLFIAALFLRSVQPLQYEPAHTAAQIVNRYAARPHVGLWVFLIAMPLVVLLSGCATLLRGWTHEVELRRAARDTLATLRSHGGTVLVAGATVTAAGILAIVALHVMTD